MASTNFGPETGRCMYIVLIWPSGSPATARWWLGVGAAPSQVEQPLYACACRHHAVLITLGLQPRRRARVARAGGLAGWRHRTRWTSMEGEVRACVVRRALASACIHRRRQPPSFYALGGPTQFARATMTAVSSAWCADRCLRLLPSLSLRLTLDN